MQALRDIVSGLQSASALIDCVQQVGKVVDEQLFEKLLSALVQAVAEAGSAKAQTSTPERPDDSSVLTRVPEVSLMQPRGKFEMLFCKDCLCMANARAVLKVPYRDVASVHILDELPEERCGKVYLMLELAAGKHITHSKKELRCLVLEVKEGAKFDVPHPKVLKDGSRPANVTGEQAVVLCTLFGAMKVTSFQTPDSALFRSSAALPCLSAYIKASKGWLFPLPKALAYIGTPCMLVPHSSILGVDMPGADQSRRTFDIVVHDAEGNVVVEFGQVDSRELNSWLTYMAAVKMKQVTTEDAAANGNGRVANEGDEDAEDSADDDDDDDDDDDFDPSVTKRARLDEAGPSNRAVEDDEGDGDEDEDEDDEDEEVEMVDEEGCTVADLKRHREKGGE